MKAKIVDSINTCDEYYEFLDKVRASESYEAAERLFNQLSGK